MQEFINYIYSIDINDSYGIGVFTERNKMAPNNVIKTGMESSLPKFTWNANRNNLYFKNTKFVIFIYDDNKEIIAGEYVEGTSYRMGQSTKNTIINNTNNNFYMQVHGFRDTASDAYSSSLIKFSKSALF